MTGGRGPDACIEAVGMEAHGTGFAAASDYSKQRMKLSFDRPLALRRAIQACAKGGTVSIPGVYGGVLDKIPFGAAIAPSFVITHRLPLEEAPRAYPTFRDKQDQCVKVVLDPWPERQAA
jgi:threonine dehydrogenase-like Zn-dependent dehydrogenase